MQVYVQGIRASATFIKRNEAKEWAAEKERILKSAKEISSIPHKLALQSWSTQRKLFIDGSDTYSHDDIVSAAFPVNDLCGIYFLIKNSKIVYVGQSISILGRVSAHKREKQFDSVAMVECSREDLSRLELFYIRKFKPELNVAGIERVIENIEDLLEPLA